MSDRTMSHRRTGDPGGAHEHPGPAIVLEGVTKTYGEGEVAVHALRDVDLSIRRGELVVVLGPSGSGKTTLLNVIGAIDAPSSGRVIVDGRDTTGLDRRGRTVFRRDHVGFVFQFFNLIPTLTARENVEVVLELTGHHDGRTAGEVLEAVGLAERLGHFPGALSGGEQQRVAIARALAKNPPILLCDEPTGTLDPETGRSVLALLRGVVDGDRRTGVLVTHNSAIAPMADRVIRMRSGRLVSDEPVKRPLPPEELSW